jgi:lipoprotein-anchoring transpeptidase ErfK/SrfK
MKKYLRPLVIIFASLLVVFILIGFLLIDGPVDSNIDNNVPNSADKANGKASNAGKSAIIKETGSYIVIDRYINKLYLRTESKVILEALCSTGTGAELEDSVSGRRWIFETPRGVFKVDAKLENPWWRKPDWAFIEEGEAIPTDDQERLDPEMLGEFALGFGDGYFIHGTLYERLLGVNVTHGCVRLGSEDLTILYKNVKIGTRVYVY